MTTVHGEPPLLLLLLLAPPPLLLLPPPPPPFSFFFFLSLVREFLAKMALNALPTISLSSLACVCVCIIDTHVGTCTHKGNTCMYTTADTCTYVYTCRYVVYTHMYVLSGRAVRVSMYYMYTETSKTRMLFTHTDFVEACHKNSKCVTHCSYKGVLEGIL